MSSVKKPISQKRADKEKLEKQTLKWVFRVFLVGLAAECYLFFVYRGYVMGSVNSLLIWHKILTAGMWLGLVALIAGVAVGIARKNDPKLRKIMPWVALAGGFLAVSGWVITRFFTNNAGIIAMCILVPIAVVLALVYLLYQHECALSTVLLSGAMFSVWVRGASSDSGRWGMPVVIGCVMVLILLGVAAYLVNKARQDGGKLWDIQVFTQECDYRVLFGVVAVAAAGVLLAVVLPGICYYLMWAVGVAIFAELVYYTTKLM